MKEAFNCHWKILENSFLKLWKHTCPYEIAILSFLMEDGFLRDVHNLCWFKLLKFKVVFLVYYWWDYTLLQTLMRTIWGSSKILKQNYCMIQPFHFWVYLKRTENRDRRSNAGARVEDGRPGVGTWWVEPQLRWRETFWRWMGRCLHSNVKMLSAPELYIWKGLKWQISCFECYHHF